MNARVLGIVLVVFMVPSGTMAQTIRPGGGGGAGGADGCGSAACTMVTSLAGDDGTTTAGGGFTFDGDSDTSLTRTAANTFGLFTGGTLRLLLDTVLYSDVNITLRSSTTNRATLSAAAATSEALFSSVDANAGALRIGAARADVGANGGINANARVGCFGEALTATSSTPQFCAWGSGAYGVETILTVAIADDGAGTSPTSTTAPTSSVVLVTCADANGCNYNPSDTGTNDGWVLHIVNGGSANTVTINDSAGNVDVPGGSLALAINNMAYCVRISAAIGFACR